MRLFIAVQLPQNMLDALAETQALLRDTVHGRFVGSDLFHVTLAFLGEVDCMRIPEVTAALEEGCRGHEAFETRLTHLGSFGKPRYCTLWQGFDSTLKATGAWSDLAKDVRKAVKAAGFSFDDKSFVPHVTLMRNANIEKLSELPMPVSAQGIISQVTLFKSDLSGPFPVYEEIDSVELIS
ncbi:MAG: RNA 2',3'-cyclic phosphodiesterase [Coriobacteriales bacterium]|nr:RNA 2',3'-cyclic phosphodiesterase [Coriobacteriales bacterium]